MHNIFREEKNASVYSSTRIFPILKCEQYTQLKWFQYRINHRILGPSPIEENE